MFIIFFKNVSNKKLKKMALVYRAERDMKYDSTEMNDTAPGSYELSYFNKWDKKSFNILFV